MGKDLMTEHESRRQSMSKIILWFEVEPWYSSIWQTSRCHVPAIRVPASVRVSGGKPQCLQGCIAGTGQPGKPFCQPASLFWCTLKLCFSDSFQWQLAKYLANSFRPCSVFQWEEAYYLAKHIWGKIIQLQQKFASQTAAITQISTVLQVHLVICFCRIGKVSMWMWKCHRAPRSLNKSSLALTTLILVTTGFSTTLKSD